MNDYSAVAFVYTDDGWYGTRTRYIISGHTRKAGAQRLCARLKKYALNEHKYDQRDHSVTASVEQTANLKEYTYQSLGPGLYYKDHYITVEQLDEKVPPTR